MKTNNPLRDRINILIGTGKCDIGDFYLPEEPKYICNYQFSIPLNREGYNLLKQAKERLKLTERELGNIERIVKAIMYFENNDKVELFYIVEAIQYQVPELNVH